MTETLAAGVGDGCAVVGLVDDDVVVVVVVGDDEAVACIVAAAAVVAAAAGTWLEYTIAVADFVQRDSFFLMKRHTGSDCLANRQLTDYLLHFQHTSSQRLADS